MINLNDALEVISNSVSRIMASERIALPEISGRILAEDIFSDMNFPSFDKSAMDGYAIKRAEIDDDLRVVEFIPAGKMPELEVVDGCCSKIMTGAMIPKGADMVVKVEDVLRHGDFIKVVQTASKKNILFEGEDVKKGDLILSKGRRLNSVHAGLLASVGAVKPLVYKKPLVSIISTGSELVSPENFPGPSQIRNSNSSQLQVLAVESGTEVIEATQVDDNEQRIFNMVESALAKSDIVVLTGGASVGDLDFTSRIFDGLKAVTHFTRLGIQPGKPVLFATIGNKYLFGLSGNPVSSFVQFQLLLKPLIARLSGNKEQDRIIKLPLSEEKTRKKAERQLFFPVIINDNMEVQSIEYHGSAHLNSYQSANAMACFPIGVKILKKGDLVDVRPL
ncbi:MAG: molybdopterin molybdotransferase MoeA [Chlorobi bacterium]|nr:molybdopterin molybdotransferase MoeA [Chlorobiota bacterium]